MALHYTYDPVVNPDVFKLRRLIRDVNLDVTGEVDRRSETVYFADEELEGFLEDAGGDFYGAAAAALFALLADKKATMVSFKIGTYGENYQVAIRELAEHYQQKSEEYQPRTEVIEIDTGEDSEREYIERANDYMSEIDA